MPERFAPFVDLYREAARRAGHDPRRCRSASTRTASSPTPRKQAADEFFPAAAEEMSRIGRERGWPPTTRAQFDAARAPRGASVRRQSRAGDREDPAQHDLRPRALPDADERRHHAARKMMRSIELFGTKVAPVVRRETAGVEAVAAQ